MTTKASFSLLKYSFDKINMDLSNIDNKANFVLDFVPNGIYNETKGIYKLQMFFTASISEKNIVVVSLECNAIFQFRKNTKIENIPPYFYPNSIAIISDAVNNLSDALSSIITIVGTKLAGKAPDKKHPYGYGRIEYMTSLIVSGIVLYAGITALIESVKKIIHPETPNYTWITLTILIIYGRIAPREHF